MSLRALLCLAIAFFSLAFAPAPFPRPPRRGDDTEVSLASLQGTWQVVRVEYTGGARRVEEGNRLGAVRVERQRWNFVYASPTVPPVVYGLVVDGRKKLPTFDLMFRGEPYGKGLLLRRGDELKILYAFSKGRPARFTPPPAGYVLMTLRRQR
jgi:uncharacterized protein (TIGR03067 family)